MEYRFSVHGEQGNVIRDMLKDLDVLEEITSEDNDKPIVNSDGSTVDSQYSKRLLELGYSILYEGEEISKHEGSVGNTFMKE